MSASPSICYLLSPAATRNPPPSPPSPTPSTPSPTLSPSSPNSVGSVKLPIVRRRSEPFSGRRICLLLGTPWRRLESGTAWRMPTRECSNPFSFSSTTRNSVARAVLVELLEAAASRYSRELELTVLHLRFMQYRQRHPERSSRPFWIARRLQEGYRYL